MKEILVADQTCELLLDPYNGKVHQTGRYFGDRLCFHSFFFKKIKVWWLYYQINLLNAVQSLILQGNLHMQPRLPDNRYFKITKSWPPSPSSCSSPWSPPPSPPSTQSRPSWLDHDDHHNCQLPHDHHRRHAQAQRSGCAKQQGSGQTKSPTARKKVPFLIIVLLQFICRGLGSYWLKLQPDTSIGGTSWRFLQQFLFVLIIVMFWSRKALIFRWSVKNHRNPGFSWSRSAPGHRPPKDSDTIQH